MRHDHESGLQRPNVTWPSRLSTTTRAGTARLQLVHKGDVNYRYTDLANILPMGGILSIGIIAWLLDKKASCLTPHVNRRHKHTSRPGCSVSILCVAQPLVVVVQHVVIQHAVRHEQKLHDVGVRLQCSI